MGPQLLDHRVAVKNTLGAIAIAVIVVIIIAVAAVASVAAVAGQFMHEVFVGSVFSLPRCQCVCVCVRVCECAFFYICKGFYCSSSISLRNSLLLTARLHSLQFKGPLFSTLRLCGHDIRSNCTSRPTWAVRLQGRRYLEGFRCLGAGIEAGNNYTHRAWRV
ncbi:hypothetical protein B0T25DRAFT_265662 [Lasiosphaeria hispida]|uniref:Uncharacterized protein n=1 Tax=Lasiosphaeria hispida TaxID=260671 RepID=A0AAJ0HAA3_9PEZI|nr:hypothetical protein B0T25DRAFT_265662 [Lasiosphaeria hispida]